MQWLLTQVGCTLHRSCHTRPHSGRCFTLSLRECRARRAGLQSLVRSKLPIVERMAWMIAKDSPCGTVLPGGSRPEMVPSSTNRSARRSQRITDHPTALRRGSRVLGPPLASVPIKSPVASTGWWQNRPVTRVSRAGAGMDGEVQDLGTMPRSQKQGSGCLRWKPRRVRLSLPGDNGQS